MNLNPKLEQSSLLKQNADLLYRLGKVDFAANLYQDSLKIALSIPDFVLASAAFRGLASVQIERDDLKNAEWLAERAATMEKEHGLEVSHAESLHVSGLIAMLKRDFSKSLRHYETALSIHEKNEQVLLKIEVQALIADTQFEMGEFDATIDSVQSTIGYASENAAVEMAADSFRVMAKALLGRSQIGYAHECISLALRAHKSQQNLFSVVADLLVCGQILKVNGDQELSIEVLSMALEKANSSNRTRISKIIEQELRTA